MIDPKISKTNLKIIRCYVTNIEMVLEVDSNGGYLETRIRHVKSILQNNPGTVWINQYGNPRNWQSHYYGEAEGILQQSPEPFDALVVDVSTPGHCWVLRVG